MTAQAGSLAMSLRTNKVNKPAATKLEHATLGHDLFVQPNVHRAASASRAPMSAVTI